MKLIEANKTLFDKGLGLSCIENYLLYVLTYLNFNYRFLYAKSYVAMSEIAQTLNDDKISFAYFNRIPRLQDTACNLGAIRLTQRKCLVDIATCDSYCCIRVNRQFVEERYARELWRDDHFVLLCTKADAMYVLLNDNPRDVIEISDEQLIAAYDDNVVCFEVLMENVSDEIKNVLLSEFNTSLNHMQTAYEFTFANLETARDVLGIVRVTRKRIREYCSIYFNTDFMLDYLAKIDKLYAMFEYMRLRNRIDYNKINKSLFEIQKNDFEIIEIINQKMRLVK